MIPEIGNMALILALFLALSLGLLPMLGSYTGQTRLMLSAKPLAVGLGVMLLIAFAMLTIAFAQVDYGGQFIEQNTAFNDASSGFIGDGYDWCGFYLLHFTHQ